MHNALRHYILLALLAGAFCLPSDALALKPKRGIAANPATRETLQLLHGINLRKTDGRAKASFSLFFKQKNQLDEPVLMLEKATAVREDEE